MKQTVLRFGAAPAKKSGGNARERVNQSRRRRRTGRQMLNYILVLLTAAAIMAVLSLTVFFQIETITVTGTTRYAQQEMIDASGVKTGDNLFRISEKSIRKSLAQYPYVESVNIHRRLPSTLELEIIQERPLGAVRTSLGYIIIARSGKVLEVGAQTLPEDMMLVSGMYLYDPQVNRVLGEGYPADKQDEAKREEEGFIMLTRLVDAVASSSFSEITLVDFSDRLNMLIVYEDRVMIELGTEADLDYKLKFLKRIIDEELEPGFEGVLDASLASSSREVWKTPCNITQRLEQRQISLQQAQEEPENTQPVSGQSDNPDFAVIPGSNSSSRNASGTSSASTSSGYINPEDFAVIQPESSSSEAGESTSSSMEQSS